MHHIVAGIILGHGGRSWSGSDSVVAAIILMVIVGVAIRGRN